MSRRRTRGDPYSWQEKTIRNAVLATAVELRLSAKLAEMWRRFPFEYDDLMVYIHNKLMILDQAAERAEGPIGRFWNWTIGEDPEYIEMDGIAVIQLFQFIDQEPPIAVERAGIYRVHHSDVRNWYEIASKSKPSDENSVGQPLT